MTTDDQSDDVVMLLESKVGEIQILDFETPTQGSNTVPWVGRIVDGKVIEGAVTIQIVATGEEIRTWPDVKLGNVYRRDLR